MNFFEPPSPPPDLPEPPPMPPWAGPSEAELGAPVPLRLVLARTDKVVIAVTELVAFSNGFEVLVSSRRRDRKQAGRQQWIGGGPPMGSPDDPNLLRFGIQFADGRKGSNVAFGAGGALRLYYAAKQEGREPELPEGPVIHPRGGGGGGARYDFRYWVWPLPPPGRLVFACEWPAESVPETLQEVDAALILDKAGESIRLWD